MQNRCIISRVKFHQQPNITSHYAFYSASFIRFFVPSLHSACLRSSSILTVYTTLPKIISVQLITLPKSLHNFNSQTSSAIKQYFALRVTLCIAQFSRPAFHRSSSYLTIYCTLLKNNIHATDFSCKSLHNFHSQTSSAIK